MSDVLDLLDGSIDDLADLVKFTPIPAGSHRLGLEWSYPEDDTQVIVALKLDVRETLEMANSAEEIPEPGKSTTLRFPIQNKDGSPILTKKGEPNTFGQGQLKEILLVLRETFGGASNRETIENSQGAEVIATLGVRKSKDDPDQQFNFIKALMLP